MAIRHALKRSYTFRAWSSAPEIIISEDIGLWSDVRKVRFGISVFAYHSFL